MAKSFTEHEVDKLGNRLNNIVTNLKTVGVVGAVVVFVFLMIIAHSDLDFADFVPEHKHYYQCEQPRQESVTCTQGGGCVSYTTSYGSSGNLCATE